MSDCGGWAASRWTTSQEVYSAEGQEPKLPTCMSLPAHNHVNSLLVSGYPCRDRQLPAHHRLASLYASCLPCLLITSWPAFMLPAYPACSSPVGQPSLPLLPACSSLLNQPSLPLLPACLSLQGHIGTVTSLAIIDNDGTSHLLVSGGADGRVGFWDISTMELISMESAVSVMIVGFRGWG